MTLAVGRTGGRAVGEDTAAWGARVGVVAGISDRTTGSLGLWTDETVDCVMTRWRTWRLGFQPGFPALQMAHQVHGTTVLWHEGVAAGWHIADGADGHATAQQGVLLAVTVADCVPVYLALRDGSCIALLHAGWRGVAGGILEAGVRALLGRFSAPPSDVVMHCGVSICGDCYEVGEEVARAVLGQAGPGGKTRLDLRSALVHQAAALGVTDASVSPWCTSCHRDRFFSHRAAPASAGRQVAYLGRGLR